MPASLQDAASREGLVAALVALCALQQLDGSFSDGQGGMSDMLGACMELLGDRRAVHQREDAFPKLCIARLKAALEQLRAGERAISPYFFPWLDLPCMPHNVPQTCPFPHVFSQTGDACNPSQSVAHTAKWGKSLLRCISPQHGMPTGRFRNAA